MVKRLTEDEVLAYAAIGEAVGEGPAGQAAVIHVINNRAKQSGSSLYYEAIKPGQFQAVDTAQKLVSLRAKYPASSKEFQSALMTVRSVKAGEIPDATGGATFYYANKGENAISPPSFFTKAATNGELVQIGNHVFAGKAPVPATMSAATAAARGAAAPNTDTPAETAKKIKTATEYMKDYLGYSELNPAQNTAISSFIKSNAGIDINPASTAWCAAFLNSVLAASGQDTQMTVGGVRAQEFLKWGEAVTLPQPGDIVVFTRGGTQGHVGIFQSMNEDGTINVLGGNQDDSVSEAAFTTDNVLGYRRGNGQVPPESSILSFSSIVNAAVGAAVGEKVASEPPTGLWDGSGGSWNQLLKNFVDAKTAGNRLGGDSAPMKLNPDGSVAVQRRTVKMSDLGNIVGGAAVPPQPLTAIIKTNRDVIKVSDLGGVKISQSLPASLFPTRAQTAGVPGNTKVADLTNSNYGASVPGVTDAKEDRFRPYKAPVTQGVGNFVRPSTIASNGRNPALTQIVPGGTYNPQSTQFSDVYKSIQNMPTGAAARPGANLISSGSGGSTPRTPTDWSKVPTIKREPTSITPATGNSDSRPGYAPMPAGDRPSNPLNPGTVGLKRPLPTVSRLKEYTGLPTKQTVMVKKTINVLNPAYQQLMNFSGSPDDRDGGIKLGVGAVGGVAKYIQQVVEVPVVKLIPGRSAIVQMQSQQSIPEVSRELVRTNGYVYTRNSDGSLAPTAAAEKAIARDRLTADRTGSTYEQTQSRLEATQSQLRDPSRWGL